MSENKFDTINDPNDYIGKTVKLIDMDSDVSYVQIEFTDNSIIKIESCEFYGDRHIEIFEK